mmetsp:Transcript_13073/g.12927  ORF Transcript_13073/g.12927 Transcript_13073/m.12927 type:complete len:109 (-) Transcript_13073:1449-1775(-)
MYNSSTNLKYQQHLKDLLKISSNEPLSTSPDIKDPSPAKISDVKKMDPKELENKFEKAKKDINDMPFYHYGEEDDAGSYIEDEDNPQDSESQSREHSFILPGSYPYSK